jgi:ubiquinone/menaquinone biosynthesis C-methylase UbiE
MSYYREVGQYYDKDAVDFERRYHLNPALQRIRQSFRERVKLHPQSTVLEVGFGPGFDLVHFAEQFPEQQYYGIDISEVSIRNAKVLAAEAEVDKICDYEVMDAEKMTYPNDTFDLVHEYGALHHVDLEASLKEVSRVLKPDGTFVCTEALRHNPLH